ELFFRFAFVPLIENRFTVEGYTLFSLNHLLDIINFVILLLPAFPILITLLFLLPVKKIFIQQDYKFLLILLMSVLGIIFIFDPKMGMPRDWDLFSFVGVPLVLFCFYLLLDSKILIQNYMPLTIMAIVLNLFLLVPRVVSQINPDISIAHLKNYFTLDKIKNRTARFPLINYYESVYDIVSANKVRNERDKNFPERFLGYKGVELLNKGKYLDAIPYFEEMMKKNPIFYDPYNNLAVCLLSLKYTDSALTLLEIADGLNPYNIQTYYNIATCYYDKNQFNKAERWWQKAIDLDDTFFEPYLDLLALYKKLNLKEEYFKYFLQAAAHNEAPL
ncbi:MAG: tetratricopeptide repeat protein, partial [Candidatus Zixiibacteriota bacterium]